MPDLESFNRFVMACQDEAFTLATYLLADDRAADAAVQAACLRAYRRHRRLPGVPVRLLILQEVLAHCERPVRKPDKEPLEWLFDLPLRERQSLLLVDLLSLSYAQAAEVLGCPREQLARRLARARLRIGADARQGRLAGPIGAS
jgi:DNA-directed RNA polymerase specialized sigma24 family protein